MALMANRIGIVAAVLFGVGATVGCGGRSANTVPAASAARATDGDEAAAGLTEHHRYHHHGGVTLFIAMSLDTLGYSPEQRAAVEKIRTDLHARMEPARAAEQNLMASLADGLAAANLDAAKVDAAVARVTAAAAEAYDASVDALSALHDVLTPPERAALVDKVEAHWAVWQKANAEETGPVKQADHLSPLVDDLGLTADQVTKIRAGLGGSMKAVPRFDPQQIATRLRTFGDAFRGDKVDVKGLTAASDANTHMVGWGAAHLAHFVETVISVLSPDQRAKLAQRLREHATHDPSVQVNP